MRDQVTETLTHHADLTREHPVPGVVAIFTDGVGALLQGRAVRESLFVGRSDEVDLTLDDPKVSRRHARLEPAGGGVLVEDLGSRNGVVVDGERIKSDRSLARVGAMVRIGNTLLVVVADAPRYESFEEPSDELLGGPALSPIRELIRQAAPTEAPVLVIGESGVGKELIAQSIHRQSGRAGSLVAVNCAALPSELIEAELFGHARGAFSGAGGERQGLVRSAAGGTLFLDEIGEMPTPVQPKLLRLLESGEVRPVGQDDAVAVSFRLIAATNAHLGSAVAGGRFRTDLYHRLAVVTIEALPLRAHVEDIPRLFQHFLSTDGQSSAMPSVEAVERLIAWHWPGNVRELRNVARLALAKLAGDDRIRVHHLPAPMQEVQPRPAQDDQRAELEAILVETGGNVSEAARRLGMRRQGLYDQLQRLGIDPKSFRRR